MEKNKDLRVFAEEIRVETIKELAHLGFGHIGGSMSVVETLAVLYGGQMNYDPKNPTLESRDRLVMSKGHAGPALYATLALKGFFPLERLLTLNQGGTSLPSHCDRLKTPGVDMTTGSLGQGFSCAMGAAKASKIRRDGAVIYTIIGDGESQEGQIWEAAMFASQHKLDNVIAFTDYNRMQIDGDLEDICSLEPLADKWTAFGWNTIEVADGNDVDQIDRAIAQAKQADKPSMIILHTVKGKGVKFIEEMGFGNHSIPMTREQMEAAIAEVKGE